MAFHYLTNAPLEEAYHAFMCEVEQSNFERKNEKIRVRTSLGRMTSCAIYAKICTPHYNACAMDGIAVKASSLFGATETTPITLNKEQYVVVDTGDALPANCDAVVMIEDVVEDVDGKVLIYRAVSPWQNVRQIGEDYSVGDMILPSHTQITPVAMGAMLACGVTEVEVIKKPVVGIIPTGDEIVMETDAPREGEIIEFNSAIFGGMIEEKGAVPMIYPIVKDDIDSIYQAVERATKECDIVLLNAGSSAGRDDYTERVIRRIGKVICHGVAIKPGKPVVLGLAKNTPIIGVPGYPISGIIVIEQFVYPLLDKLLLEGIVDTPTNQKKTVEATILKNYVSSVKYQEFVRGKIGYINGQLVCVPMNKGAGVVSSLVKADGIMVVPQNMEGYQVGGTVEVQLLKDMDSIQNMLMIIGSHDPMIDEITDIMKRKYPEYSISSSHVGSMGGIMSLKRKEAHLGAIHILDEQTGKYNVDLVKRYFKNQEVTLIEGVKRIQGIIVQKGNPKNIREIVDIAKENVSYVNRQKGSGTRVLLDFLLKREGIEAKNVYGYEREEFTHTNVAAIIAAGSADAGLGIYSVAKLYDLDFIPLCEESYDFVVAKETLNLPAFQMFLNVLKSDELKCRLNEIGGYHLCNPADTIIIP